MASICVCAVRTRSLRADRATRVNSSASVLGYETACYLLDSTGRLAAAAVGVAGGVQASGHCSAAARMRVSSTAPRKSRNNVSNSTRQCLTTSRAIPAANNPVGKPRMKPDQKQFESVVSMLDLPESTTAACSIRAQHVGSHRRRFKKFKERTCAQCTNESRLAQANGLPTLPERLFATPLPACDLGRGGLHAACLSNFALIAAQRCEGKGWRKRSKSSLLTGELAHQRQGDQRSAACEEHSCAYQHHLTHAQRR